MLKIIGSADKNGFPVRTETVDMTLEQAVNYVLSNSFAFSNWSLLRENITMIVDNDNFILADIDLGFNVVYRHDRGEIMGF